MSSFQDKGIVGSAPSLHAIVRELPEALREKFVSGIYSQWFVANDDTFDATARFWARGYETNWRKLEVDYTQFSKNHATGWRVASDQSVTLAQHAHSVKEVDWYNGGSATTLSVLLGTDPRDEKRLISLLDNGLAYGPGYAFLLEPEALARFTEIQRVVSNFGPWPRGLGNIEEWTRGLDLDTVLCINARRAGYPERVDEGIRYMEAVRKLQPGATFETVYPLLRFDLVTLERYAEQGIPLEYMLSVEA